MKLPVLRMGFIQLNCWFKSAVVTPNNPGYLKSIGCSPQTDNTLLMKTTPMQFLEYGEIELCAHLEFSPIWATVIGSRRHSVYSSKKKKNS